MIRNTYLTLVGVILLVLLSGSVIKASNLNRHSDDPSYKYALESLQKTVPLTYNTAVQNQINYLSKSHKERFGRMVGLSQYYFPIYEKIFQGRTVPDEIKYLSVIESSLNPNAVSRAGAAGLWQFLYEMGKIYGLTVNDSIDERRDPVLACNAAASYLLDSYAMYNDWLLAIASYNCGRNNIRWAMEKAEGGPKDYWSIRKFLPVETQNYVPIYIATVYIMNNYKKHGIVPIEPHFSTINETLIINKNISLAAISQQTKISVSELSQLNPAYLTHKIDGIEECPKTLVIPVLPTFSYNSLCSMLGIESNRPTETATTHAVFQAKKTYSFITYRVQPGDTIALIADKFDGTTEEEITSANRITEGNLQVGKLLKIAKH